MADSEYVVVGGLIWTKNGINVRARVHMRVRPLDPQLEICWRQVAIVHLLQHGHGRLLADAGAFVVFAVGEENPILIMRLILFLNNLLEAFRKKRIVIFLFHIQHF